MEQSVSTYKKIRRLYRQSQKYAASRMEQPELTQSELQLLRHVGFHGEVSQRHLADEMGVDKAMISRILQKLEAKGYLVRTEDENDARSKMCAPCPLRWRSTPRERAFQSSSSTRSLETFPLKNGASGPAPGPYAGKREGAGSRPCSGKGGPSMKYVIRYVKPHIPTMIFGFTIKFTGTILDLMIPYILSYIIDEVTPRNDIGLVIRWGLMMAVCAALVLVCNVWANRVASAVSGDSIEALRHDLFYKISYLSSSQVDAFTIPSLVTRMTTDTYNLHRTLNMIQRMGVRAPILMLGGVVVTMFIDPWLSAILCFLIPFMILAVARISRKSIPLFGKAQIAADAMIRVVRENATGIRVIKALSRTEYEKDRYETVNSRLNAAEAKASITMAASGPLINLMLNTGLAAVIVVGAWRVSTGAMKPGAIVAFLTYFTIILNSVMAISRLITMSSKAIASAGRVEEVMMTPQDMEIRPWTGRPETAPGASPDAPDRTSGKRPPHMEFDHVSFSYNKRAYNLSDLSFSLEHGQSLGIIGPTGAGKSTLAQLLLRLYDIDSGQIRIDGRDISTFPLKELRQKFGVVFQNDVLFKDSLLNNIDMGRKLDMDAIDRAVEVAQAASFIAGSGGYEKPIAVKGVNLSGGQKQRVLIARALAGRPEFLILDDSSSALDYKTDAAFRRSLSKSFSGTTTIIIAQRISSIMHCDKILVLEDGIPQGLGTHEELLKTCDAYREISTIQMGGEDL